MRSKICVYSKCKSDSRYAHKEHMNGVFFIPFPKPKRSLDRCKKWLEFLGRDDYPMERISGDTYLCSRHFVGMNGPTLKFPEPVHHEQLVTILKQPTTDIEPNITIYVPSINPIQDSQSSNRNDMEQQNQDSGIEMVQGQKPISIPENSLNHNDSDTLVPPAIENVTQSHENMEIYQEFHDMEIVEEQNPIFDKICIVSSTPKCPKKNNTTVVQAQKEQPPPEFLTTGFAEIFSEFSCPFNWSITRFKDCLKIRKLDENTGETILGISINNLFEAAYVVNGRNLNDKTALSIMPKYINNRNELQEVIEKISSLKLCIGNNQEEYIAIFKNRSDSLGFETKDRSIHSQNCTLVLKTYEKKRCFFCIKHRASFRVIARRRRNKLQSSATPFKNMSKTELISKLRYSKVSEYKLKGKIKRLEKKIGKQIVKSGEELEDDKHDFFMQILEKHIGKQNNGSTSDEKTTTECQSWNKGNSEFSALFLATQLKMHKKNPSGRRWHPLVMQWCLFMHEKSPGLYNVLNQSGVLQLPSKSTLRRHSSNIENQMGFRPEAFQKLRDDLKTFQKTNDTNFFCLVLDEIKVQEQLVYKAESGELIGFTELNNVEQRLTELNSELYKDKALATHILQFMVRGITSGYKYPFAHFATSSLTAEKLDSLMWEAIRKLEFSGLKILCVVGDGAATNRKCYTMNGDYKCKNPFSSTDERLVYFLFDPPHLIKTVRNCLLNSKANSTCRQMKINGEHLMWNTIREVYRIDSAKGNLRKLYKLSEKHLDGKNRMKVKYTTQVLSNSVAQALKIYFPNTCTELIRFIDIFNKWFDIMNVGHLLEGYYTRNKNVGPFQSKNDCRLSWLENDFLGYLEEWESYVNNLSVKEKEKKAMLLSQETLAGLRQTTKCILELVPFLLENGAKFVLTDHVNQDPLEQYFSKQRQACKAGSNPTVYKYCITAPKLQTLAEGRIKIKIGGGNTQ